MVWLVVSLGGGVGLRVCILVCAIDSGGFAIWFRVLFSRHSRFVDRCWWYFPGALAFCGLVRYRFCLGGFGWILGLASCVFVCFDAV